MPRHLELIESCASCLQHGNSVSSVACDLLYKNHKSLYLFTSVVKIKPLYIENYHMRTNGHRPKGKVNLSQQSISNQSAIK